jgi:hypothetical protein
VGELAASRHGAISRRQAAHIGLGRNAIARLIERGVLQEPVPGVMTAAGIPTREAFDQRRDDELAIEGWHTAYAGWSDATRTPASVRRTLERIATGRAMDLGIDLRALVNPQRPTAGR